LIDQAEECYICSTIDINNSCIELQELNNEIKIKKEKIFDKLKKNFG